MNRHIAYIARPARLLTVLVALAALALGAIATPQPAEAAKRVTYSGHSARLGGQAQLVTRQRAHRATLRIRGARCLADATLRFRIRQTRKGQLRGSAHQRWNDHGTRVRARAHWRGKRTSKRVKGTLRISVSRRGEDGPGTRCQIRAHLRLKRVRHQQPRIPSIGQYAGGAVDADNPYAAGTSITAVVRSRRGPNRITMQVKHLLTGVSPLSTSCLAAETYAPVRTRIQLRQRGKRLSGATLHTDRTEIVPGVAIEVRTRVQFQGRASRHRIAGQLTADGSLWRVTGDEAERVHSCDPVIARIALGDSAAMLIGSADYRGMAQVGDQSAAAKLEITDAASSRGRIAITEPLPVTCDDGTTQHRTMSVPVRLTPRTIDGAIQLLDRSAVTSTNFHGEVLPHGPASLQRGQEIVQGTLTYVRENEDATCSATADVSLRVF